MPVSASGVLSGDAGLWTLFASALISSTILPGGSEALFAAMAWQQTHSPATLLLVASLGNTAGGMTSWGLGRLLARLPASAPAQDAHQVAVARVRRFGAPALLLSWLPIVGDPLCVAAGWLRIGWLQSLTFIAVGKTLRYAVVLAAVG